MKKISKILEYQGDTLKPDVLYTGHAESFLVYGDAQFIVFNKVRVGGCVLDTGTYQFTFDESVEIEIMKDSGLLFTRVPYEQKEVPLSKGVDPVPTEEDDQIRAMGELLEKYMNLTGKRIIQPKEVEDAEQDVDDIEIDDTYDVAADIDDDGLVEDEEKDEIIKEPEEIEPSKPTPIAEPEKSKKETEEKSDQEEEGGDPKTVD